MVVEVIRPTVPRPAAAATTMRPGFGSSARSPRRGRRPSPPGSAHPLRESAAGWWTVFGGKLTSSRVQEHPDRRDRLCIVDRQLIVDNLNRQPLPSTDQSLDGDVIGQPTARNRFVRVANSLVMPESATSEFCPIWCRHRGEGRGGETIVAPPLVSPRHVSRPAGMCSRHYGRGLEGVAAVAPRRQSELVGHSVSRRGRAPALADRISPNLMRCATRRLSDTLWVGLALPVGDGSPGKRPSSCWEGARPSRSVPAGRAGMLRFTRGRQRVCNPTSHRNALTRWDVPR